MKSSFVKSFLSLLSIFYLHSCFAEGFTSETLVKVSDGYVPIQSLSVGDHVICYDIENRLVDGLITHIIQKCVEQYVCITIDNESICVAYDQKLYNEHSNAWIIAGSLKSGDILAGKIITVNLIAEPINLYLLSIAEHHNFLISSSDICAHNFFPIILGISVAFGSGALEIAGFTCGIAGLGTFLGYQWHKKNKQKHAVVMKPHFYGGGMMPEDPDDEKNKKRNEAIANHRPLTNKQAREQAEKMGYKETKPSFDTHGELAFKKGNIYISPDNTGHNGGVWKMLHRSGERIGTYNMDLTKMIKG